MHGDRLRLYGMLGAVGRHGLTPESFEATLGGILRRARTRRAIRILQGRGQVVRSATGRIWLAPFVHVLTNVCYRCDGAREDITHDRRLFGAHEFVPMAATAGIIRMNVGTGGRNG